MPWICRPSPNEFQGRRGASGVPPTRLVSASGSGFLFVGQIGQAIGGQYPLILEDRPAIHPIRDCRISADFRQREFLARQVLIEDSAPRADPLFGRLQPGPAADLIRTRIDRVPAPGGKFCITRWFARARPVRKQLWPAAQPDVRAKRRELKFTTPGDIEKAIDVKSDIVKGGGRNIGHAAGHARTQIDGGDEVAVRLSGEFRVLVISVRAARSLRLLALSKASACGQSRARSGRDDCRATSACHWARTSGSFCSTFFGADRQPVSNNRVRQVTADQQNCNSETPDTLNYSYCRPASYHRKLNLATSEGS